MDKPEITTLIPMADYLAELEKRPSVIRRTYPSPDGVIFHIFFEDHETHGGKVLYSLHGEPFKLIDAETLRLIVGDAQWSVISGPPTKQLR